jgi:hypothetical protein
MIGPYVEDEVTGITLGRITHESGDYVWVKPDFGPGGWMERASVRECDPLLGMCESVLRWIARNGLAAKETAVGIYAH